MRIDLLIVALMQLLVMAVIQRMLMDRSRMHHRFTNSHGVLVMFACFAMVVNVGLSYWQPKHMELGGRLHVYMATVISVATTIFSAYMWEHAHTLHDQDIAPNLTFNIKIGGESQGRPRHFS